MKESKEQKGVLTLLEQEEHDIFHFILLLGRTRRHTEWEAAWRPRMMGDRVRGAAVGRPMPDFTEVGRRWALPHHDHWSFPGRSVMCLRLWGAGCLLLEWPGKPQQSLLH